MYKYRQSSNQSQFKVYTYTFKSLLKRWIYLDIYVLTYNTLCFELEQFNRIKLIVSLAAM